MLCCVVLYLLTWYSSYIGGWVGGCRKYVLWYWIGIDWHWSSINQSFVQSFVQSFIHPSIHSSIHNLLIHPFDSSHPMAYTDLAQWIVVTSLRNPVESPLLYVYVSTYAVHKHMDNSQMSVALLVE